MNIKKVHLFDDAGIYTESYVAHESPLEPGIYHTPVLSTDIPLPDLDINQTCKFNGNDWDIISDYRGKIWYDKETGEPIEIIEVDLPADHLISVEPDFILKANKLRELKNQILFALNKSDIVLLRCIENDISIPPRWKTYRNELRIMMNDADITSVNLPIRPDYPPGT